ncbi:cysteine hydrolase [Rouxiella badensis]|uniref:cysteine hydrolase family protein n=1 Tax=Rouxiella badensis TaxID=1646377 RepID=UPI0013EF07A0|nr:cysteine hydrolase family protein [Rouxiella badensis]QII38295.1 cysteine hydrolase [Rouxiella badensis]
MNRKTVLLLIDVQQNVLHGVGAPERFVAIEGAFEKTIQRLADVKIKARAAGIPVIIIQHAGGEGHRVESGTEGWKIHHMLKPDEIDLVISKTTSDSFYETDLLATLEEMEVTHLIVGGFLTQYCVDLSVRRALALGFDVTLISDGHSTCDESGLSYEQIVSHHNNILTVLKLNGHGISLQSSDSIIISLKPNKPQSTE